MFRAYAKFLALLLFIAPLAQAEVSTPHQVRTRPQKSIDQGEFKRISTSLKGWDYLAEKLVEDGVRHDQVVRAYTNPKLPAFSYVYFSLAPRESHDIYSGFRTASKLTRLNNFMQKYQRSFADAERHLGVPKSVVGAILLVETHCGEVTGKNPLIYRLSRLASVGKAENLKANYLKLKSQDSNVTFDAVAARAQYLEDTFYPELGALFKIAEMRQVNILNILGSSAGAFGIPQFLPTSYLRFGRDGNRDGIISLFSNEDAIWSAANFLAAQGWDSSKPIEQNRDILWKYNKSDPYIDTVIYLAQRVGHS